MLGIAAASTNKLIRSTEDWLRTQVDEDDMPQHVLGCGNYGCVYSTWRGDTVLKVTTDPTEVFFVQQALALGDLPDGIVRYDRILAVPDMSYHGRPYFFIWREAAEDVGAVFPTKTWGKQYEYEERSLLIAQGRLHQFKHWAHIAREVINRSKDPAKLLCDAASYQQWAWEKAMEADWDEGYAYREGFKRPSIPTWIKGPQRLALCLAMCKATGDMMENEYGLHVVGDALNSYLEKGLLLADVHSGNIGRVHREGSDLIVITDPGHAIDLRQLGRC